MTSLIILVLTCLLIALRPVIRIRLGIWQIMGLAALLCLLTDRISPAKALEAIDWPVIVLLAGMFVLGAGLNRSGGLHRLFHAMGASSTGARSSLLLFMLASGLLSALLTNDTLAIIGTPIALALAATKGIPGSHTLLGLALSVTMGSAISPVGNPQNFIIATYLDNPVLDFLYYLGIPGILGIVAAWGLLCLTLKPQSLIPAPQLPPYHPRLWKLSLLGLVLLASSLTLRTVLGSDPYPLWVPALLGALPLLFSVLTVRHLAADFDWQTLVFFVALFITVGAVWEEGFLKTLLMEPSINLDHLDTLALSGFGISQILSNVPLVALYAPLLDASRAEPFKFAALAGFSTLAGNLTIMGAASNVIIIQQAEKEKARAFGSGLLLVVGLPATVITVAMLLGWWKFLGLV